MTKVDAFLTNCRIADGRLVDIAIAGGKIAAVGGGTASLSNTNGLDPGSVLRASLWVPLALVAAPLAACAIGVRLNLMVPRSPEQGLTAARNG